MEGVTTIKELRKGDFFTLRPLRYPTEKQVYIRGEYDRSARKYDCGRYDDISYSRLFKPDTVVYTEFMF